MRTTSPVTRVLYRELLRSAKLLDKHAAVKALMCPSEVADSAICHKAVMGLHQHQLCYWPYESAKQRMRALFRTSPASSEALDAAFRGLRYLNAKLHLAQEYDLLHVESDELPSRPPRITTTIRRGVFLIAHPLTVRPFEQSVVLLTRHDTKGTKGVIVNDEGDAKQSSLHSYPVESALQAAFPSHPLLYGGPVATNSIQFLHPHAELGGSLVTPDEVDTPVFIQHDLSVLVKPAHANIDRSKVTFVHGHASWVPKQLQRELDAGGWLMVEAPLALVLNPPAKNLWVHMLQELGDEHAAMSRIPKSVDFYVPPEVETI
ncbi:hypothetical protein SPRG_08818 [Saprolegnia parasitica CBS 223.65]|uniref:Transcriptional regulator n=1 Tax=Saprolegnia parasitica (strain CBS 223.65) TaxID=695850 RepID=A0A067CH54_SAPPC|nr:hypothetical protein SPRG_08818 [Saprolegnia parasitica CBS 223.65]KDO25876.1 hypothetical protein SPRG_08818 [Saprolegnia parasitica CBS 223.65]|eukprot:XP_012203437.1 hypothetical protein SPRG_08818 [Saprolegnia parasitica CBS 223.65]